MAATKYTYSIANDFLNSTVASDALTSEIVNSTISGTLDYINTDNDDCDIWFVDTLSGSEEPTLSGIVTTHSGTPLPPAPAVLETGSLGVDKVPLSDGQGSTSWTHAAVASKRTYDYRMNSNASDEYIDYTGGTWKTVGNILFLGNSETPVTKMKIVSWVTSAGTSASFRIYDYGASSEVAIIDNITSETKSIYTTTLSGMPSAESIFEMQVKVDSGNGKIRLSTVLIG